MSDIFMIYLSGVFFSFMILPFILDDIRDYIIPFIAMCLFSWIFPMVAIFYSVTVAYIEFVNRVKRNK
jgi:hypothetical protein